MTHSQAPIATPLGRAIGLPELLRIVMRRKRVILTTMLIMMALSGFMISQLTPKYSATTAVMIPAREVQVVDVEAVLSGILGDLAAIESEIQIIRSRDMAARVIRALNIDEDPEFNRALQSPSLPLMELMTPLREALADIRSVIWGVPKESEATDPGGANSVDAEFTRVVDSFLDNLVAVQPGRSRVINVSFQSKNPETAANVVNKLAELYINSQREAKFEATAKANSWLSERLIELHDQVLESERLAEDFRQQSGLIQGRDATLMMQEISDLNGELLRVRTKRMESEARIKLAEKALGSEDGIESVSEVLDSSLIQSLREEEVRLYQRAAELAQRYGERHPAMIKIRAETEDLRKKIRVEIQKIIQAVRNEVEIVRTREGMLRQNLENLKTKVGELNQANVQLRALEREAEANRALYETFLARSKETSNQADIQDADAQIISLASIPVTPTHPQSVLLLVVSFVGSGFCGLLLAFTREHLSTGIHSLEDIDKHLDAAPLGLIPMTKKSSRTVTTPDAEVIEKPASAFTESIRNLIANLGLANFRKRAPEVILITSALPKEGKTTVALAIARLLAESGYRVVLVDGDLRRPAAHKSLGFSLIPGLAEFIKGEAALQDVMRSDPGSSLTLIPAGSVSSESSALLHAERLKSLLTTLVTNHDIVLIDSAPVFAVADTRMYSSLADKTVVLVRWGKTRRSNVQHVLRRLQPAGGPIAGVALTMVDIKLHAQYGDGDSAYYFGELSKYYRS
jgi:exopolysaccharide transport family protein